MRAIDKELADLMQKAKEQGLIINTYGEDGCPPCGTIPDEECCFGCPYRLREHGVDLGEI